MKTKTILLVDQDPTVAEAIALALANKNVTFYFALGLKDALEVIAEHIHDLTLVIADVEPRGHAMALMTAIKAHRDNLPMIVIGASANLEANAERLSEGAYKIMRMPINFMRLRGIVYGLEDIHAVNPHSVDRDTAAVSITGLAGAAS